MIQHQDRLDTLLTRLPDLDLRGRLSTIMEKLGPPPVFTTSLGIEDQVITAAIVEAKLPIRIVTLHTGRLFAETVDLIERTEARYGIGIVDCKYDLADEAAFVETYGLNGFYESVGARHACCWFRKMKPLAAALKGADTWITGLRQGQSPSRATTRFAEHDRVRNLIKVNPLADWDLDTVKAFVREHDVPINPLHARGFPSIGCEPCTRAIRSGEPERAGRWWWETDHQRECGLHVQSAPLPDHGRTAESTHA